MKVIITGATGFLGKYVTRGLLENGFQLTLIGRNLERLKKTYKKWETDLQLETLDFNSPLHPLLKGHHAMVHLGGMKYNDKALLHNYIISNFNSSLMLFESACRAGIQNIIFASTRLVYQNTSGKLPFEETANIYPENHYAYSKVLCEHAAHYFNTHCNMNIKILRLGQVVGIGADQEYMLGEFMKRARSKWPLEIWGSGSGKRDYIYAKDLANAIKICLDQSLKKGIYNISMGKAISHLELAETINRAFQNENNIKFLKDKKEDLSQVYLNVTKAEKELGWNPKWSLKAMFEDIILDSQLE